MNSINLLRELTHTAANENKRLGITDLFWINEIEDNGEVLVLWDMVQHNNKENRVIDVFAYNMIFNQMQRRFNRHPLDIEPLFYRIGKTIVVEYDHNNKEGLKHHFKDAFWNAMADNCTGIERQPHAFHYTFCDVYMKGEEKQGVSTFDFEDVLKKFDVYIADASRCSSLPTSTRQDNFGIHDGTDKLGALVICKENMCIYTYGLRVYGGLQLTQRREIILEKSYKRWLRDNAQRLRNGEYVLLNNN